MALLSIANLVVSVGDRRLLDGVNLTLDAGAHVGLVGRNGCGKSTLLKLIAGRSPLKPADGHIQLARGATVGYLTQDPDLNPARTLREEAGAAFAELDRLHRRLERISHEMAEASDGRLEKLLKEYEKVEHRVQAAGGYAVDHRIDATLHGLGLGDEFFGVKVADLSGGQKGRLALAKLLLSGPDLLLLDEPTNHLDIAGRQWLEQYLADYAGTVILVSHDRWLLDRSVRRIYEIEAGALDEYPGNYAAFRTQRVERRLARQRIYDKQQEKIRNEQAFIDRYRAGQRSAQAQGRAKRLERFKRDEAVAPVAQLDEMNIRIPPAPRAGDLVITADAIAKGYEGKPLFDNLSAVIKRGDRVGIIGPNGAGKTTLVRALLGQIAPDRGKVRLGSGVSVGHYRQTHEHLDPGETVVDYLRRFVPGATEQAARDLAGAFLFSGEEQDKPLGALSGGERSRAVLAGLIVGRHNLLVLDEPTNHLDIPSAERLETALRRFTAEPGGYGQKAAEGGGTLLLITHDRMLLDALVDQLIVLDGRGNARHFLGTYSDYVEAQRAAASPGAPGKTAGAAAPAAMGSAEPAPPAKTGAAPPSPSARSRSAAKSKPARPGSALTRLNQEALERKIVKIEAKLAELDAELADPDIYRHGDRVKRVQARRHKLAAELAPLENEWTRRAEA